MRIAALATTLFAWPCLIVLLPYGYWDEKALWLMATPVAGGIAYWLAGLLRR